MMRKCDFELIPLQLFYNTYISIYGINNNEVTSSLIVSFSCCNTWDTSPATTSTPIRALPTASPLPPSNSSLLSCPDRFSILIR